MSPWRATCNGSIRNYLQLSNGNDGDDDEAADDGDDDDNDEIGWRDGTKEIKRETRQRKTVAL